MTQGTITERSKAKAKRTNSSPAPARRVLSPEWKEEPSNACVGRGHGASSSLADALAEATGEAPHHFVSASCSGSEWVDFELTLSADDDHCNYTYLEDLTAATGQPDPTALLLHMYDYEIPQDRKPNHTAMRAIDGMYALAISRHNFREGTTYYISTHCEGVGVASHRFRRVVHQIEEFVALDRKHRYGEVSPAEWVYHSCTVPTDCQTHEQATAPPPRTLNSAIEQSASEQHGSGDIGIPITGMGIARSNAKYSHRENLDTCAAPTTPKLLTPTAMTTSVSHICLDDEVAGTIELSDEQTWWRELQPPWPILSRAIAATTPPSPPSPSSPSPSSPSPSRSLPLLTSLATAGGIALLLTGLSRVHFRNSVASYKPFSSLLLPLLLIVPAVNAQACLTPAGRPRPCTSSTTPRSFNRCPVCART